MNTFEYEIFIQPKTKVSFETNKKMYIKDLCKVIGKEEIVNIINEIEVGATKDKENSFIIPIMQIIKLIKKNHPDILLQIVNERDILIEITKNINKNKLFEFIKILIVCIFVFIIAAVAIMNFHADVNMLGAQQFFYKLITGVEKEKPLAISIPYSFGIGIGMLVFFNHISVKSKYRNQPSPLDLEVYSYQNDLDEYVRNKSRENNNQ